MENICDYKIVKKLVNTKRQSKKIIAKNLDGYV